ncbi:hypothetical protein ISF_04375 [Cordyceps fumosorosea ARSEF 2679]|uniref:Low temperature requirement A n=1 Tax=Cordyceps fumosorosea (strain ARSEF 2679) TaxID=1081104 RepID=A0A167XGT5_CORFA|nr:hypothetical protein ISF_04375 [Cordyceps fumosorosea ARSEF 2679]OAA64965.1 hypothetical protein ISF_04375 [Cordyceps fumosorosea ARSEF 2679]
MSKEALYEPVPSTRLKVFSTPIKSEADDHHNHYEDEEGHSIDDGRYAPDHRRHPDNYPQLQRHEEPTLLEIFYDLFFAATYNAYCDSKTVTNHASFKASIGFFCLLWVTWFNVTLFDVRYATDSIFSITARLNTAIQLGVLIGFVVVAPKFNPTTQDAPTMRAMSIILAISRFNLMGQYAWMAFHVRRYRTTRLPLLVQMAIYTAAAAAYLGLTWRFGEDRHSHAYVTWYCVSAAEGVASLLLSNYSPILSLGRTHLMKRLGLLTVMILGEGIESIAKKVLVIVKNKHAWDTTTIGLVTAAAATVYFVFLVYFDWLGAKTHLPPVRRNAWVALHLPFHLALVLFMQGFTQMLIWGKIARQVNVALDFADPTDLPEVLAGQATTFSVSSSVNASVRDFLEDYPSKLESTTMVINTALRNISSLPDDFWPALTRVANEASGSSDASLTDADRSYATLRAAGETLAASMANNVFRAFNTEVSGEIESKNKDLETKDREGFQFKLERDNWARYGLVFAYTYISAACVIVFVLALKQLTDGHVPKGWNLIRQIIIFGLALGTGLATIVWFNSLRVFAWLQTPWVMPTLCFVWMTIVILTHVNIGGVKLNPSHLKWRSRK